jgi:hypothetical protein
MQMAVEDLPLFENFIKSMGPANREGIQTNLGFRWAVACGISETAQRNSGIAGGWRQFIGESRPI